MPESILGLEGWKGVSISLVYAAGVLFSLRILRQPREPMVMLLWMVTIFLLPWVAIPLYLLFGERRVLRRGRKKLRRTRPVIEALRQAAAEARAGGMEAGAGGAAPQGPAALLATESLRDGSLLELAEISDRLGDFRLTGGNRVEAFLSPARTYEAILEAVRAAESHVHLEYYIFRPDETGALLRDALVEKARAGVEVRLLVDGIGSFFTPRSFFRPLVEAGGRVATFSPGIPLRSPWHINCRNHRKIVVVDGRTAFTGSQNIGDEYRGLLRRLGPWKDTHLKLEGPCVRDLQEVFVEDWFFAAREDLASGAYLRANPPCGGSICKIFATGPDQANPVLSHLFFAAIGLARRSVRIGTPYFVPDPGLLQALQNAGYRGLDVEILIPARTDQRLVLWAGRSYYEDLIASGVRIHEFDHGMLHSKWVGIDDRWSLIGSANMDIRSFLYNFEVTVTLFDDAIAGTLAEDFRDDLRRSRRIAAQRPERRKLLPPLVEGLARLCSPLL